MKRLITLLVACCVASSVLASEANLQTVYIGRDVPTMERGADNLMNNCHSCHSLKYVKYRDLLALGIGKEKVDGWRGDQPLDAPLLAQMSEGDAMQSFGKAPPDLSMMAKARDGGVNYVYSYLLAYHTEKDGSLVNPVYPETKMPDALSISTATDDAQRAQIQVQAHDIVSFLAWVADPHAAERERLGYYVIAYLLVLTTLLYFVKTQVWSKLK